MTTIIPGPLSVDEAVRLEQAGERLRFRFFWGHRPRPDGTPGEACLSQWWPSPFTVDGIEYATAEHYLMAGKARLFGDEESVRRIVSTSRPDEAQILGRRVRGFSEPLWATHRVDLVVRGNHAKFSQHPDLGQFLLGTGGRVLAEASPVDRVWGIGVSATDARASRPSAWQGLNLLGFALMRVRHTLQSAPPAQG